MSCRAEIDADGFATLPERFPIKDLDRLLNEVDHFSPRRSRAGLRHALSLPPVVALARRPQLLHVAQSVLGAEAIPFRATLFDKSPRANWLVVWHQDTALPLRERRDLAGWGPWSVKDGIHYAHAPAAVLSQVLALRVHLDDSTDQNGPLRVLPGTHTRGVLTDDMLHELSLRIKPVACVTPKGGILAMRPLLVHSSSKSQSEVPRRVLHIEYAASESIARPLELACA